MPSPSGLFSIFVYRNWGQTSQQATTELSRKTNPLLIPRTGTAAPIGAPTMIYRPISPKR